MRRSPFVSNLLCSIVLFAHWSVWQAEGLSLACRCDIRSRQVSLSTSPSQLLFLAEMTMKIALNAITTGAHVLKGKVR